MKKPSAGLAFTLLSPLNTIGCRVMYGVTAPAACSLPPSGPVLLVSNHVSFSDPFVLQATAGRPIRFLMAQEFFDRLPWRGVLRALHYIPVSRGFPDVGAVRTMVRLLEQGEVVGVFPEGGIDTFRDEQGHRGVAYLALKTGAPVVPASIEWNKIRPLSLLGSFLTPGRVSVRYGPPLTLGQHMNPNRDHITEARTQIMEAIRVLRAEGE